MQSSVARGVDDIVSTGDGVCIQPHANQRFAMSYPDSYSTLYPHVTSSLFLPHSTVSALTIPPPLAIVLFTMIISYPRTSILICDLNLLFYSPSYFPLPIVLLQREILRFYFCSFCSLIWSCSSVFMLLVTPYSLLSANLPHSRPRPCATSLNCIF